MKRKHRLFNVMHRTATGLAVLFALMAVSCLIMFAAIRLSASRMRAALFTFPLCVELDEQHGKAEDIAVAPHGRFWAHGLSATYRPWGRQFRDLFDLHAALWPRVRFDQYRGIASMTIDVPLWMLVLVSGAPAFVMHRLRLADRRRAGLCRTCGYDLRATPDRCPECGTQPKRLSGIST
jgi:hypothetical protein